MQMLSASRSDEKSRQPIERIMCLINMKIRLLFLIGLLATFSCENEDTFADNEFIVIVESTADLACALPVIRFLEKGEEVKKRTKLETLTYNAYHLDNSLNVTGEKLIIEFGEVRDEDLRACNTLGIGILGISILKARLTN